MSAIWTREHDAVIARVAEGLRICAAGFINPGIGYDPLHIDSYSTDIRAGIRAAEAWRKQGLLRSYSIESPEANSEVFYARFNAPSTRYYLTGTGGTMDEALAWALYAACGGGE